MWKLRTGDSRSRPVRRTAATRAVRTRQQEEEDDSSVLAAGELRAATRLYRPNTVAVWRFRVDRPVTPVSARRLNHPNAGIVGVRGCAVRYARTRPHRRGVSVSPSSSEMRRASVSCGRECYPWTASMCANTATPSDHAVTGGWRRGAAAAVAGRPSSGATTSVRGSDEIGLGPSRPRRPTQSESPCHRDTEWAVKPRQAGAVGDEWDAVDGDRRSRRVSNR